MKITPEKHDFNLFLKVGNQFKNQSLVKKPQVNIFFVDNYCIYITKLATKLKDYHFDCNLLRLVIARKVSKEVTLNPPNSMYKCLKKS